MQLMTGNLVQGNSIGTNAAGTSGIGNSEAGVHINGSASGNKVGADATLGNRIAFNGGDGVKIDGAGGSNGPAVGNLIRGTRFTPTF